MTADADAGAPNAGAPADSPPKTPPASVAKAPPAPGLPKEIGGAKGPEPTRYGDWEHKGRCTDF